MRNTITGFNQAFKTTQMPLLWLSLAFLTGIVLAANLHLPGYAWLGLAGLGLIIALIGAFWRRRSNPLRLPGRCSLLTDNFSFLTYRLPSLPYSLILLFLFLGAARYQYAQPNLSASGFIAAYNDGGEAVAVQGFLTELPDKRDQYIQLKLRLEAIRLPGQPDFQPVGGMLLARSYQLDDWHYGDRLVVEGELETPPEDEDFSYREYLAQQHIYSWMPFAKVSLISAGQGNLFWRLLYAFKERLLEMVYRLWPDPEASLMAGILLGVESGIPQEIVQAFQDTGTAHVIAISGFNIAIVAGLFTLLFTRLLGRVKGAILALIGILLYTLLVGAGPSVVRAALMGGLVLFAYHTGRRQVGLLTLALVAALMALANPLILWSASFQLSFFATLGLVLYARPLGQWLEGLVARRVPAETARRVSRPAAEYLLFTLAASLATLPVILYHFQRLSLVSVIANPAILPAQPPVMVLGGLAVLLGMIYEPLGQLAGWLAWPFVAYTIRAVQLFASWPGNVLAVGQISGLGVILMYAALFGLTFAWVSFKQTAALVKPGLVLVALIVLNVLVWRSALAAPDGRLHLTLLDANSDRRSGDALLIQTPTGRRVLINGGPSLSRLSEALGQRLPPFDRELDFLVVANPEGNQVGALARGIEQFTPREVLWAGQPDASPEAGYLRAALAEAEVPITQAETGQVLELGEGARLRVFLAGERGAVFLLEWGKFRALMPIGITFEELETLDYGRRVGPVTALFLVDQGYAPANPPEWIANMRPEVALLSVAAGDRAGRPDAEVLDALEGYTLLRTDQKGWIELTTDGEQMWVEVEGK